MNKSNVSLFMCILPYFNFGGAATLYYRMMRWAGQHGYKTLLVTQRNEGFEEEWVDVLQENGTNIILYREMAGRYIFCDWEGKTGNIWNESSDVICIVSYMFEFFAANECRRRMNSRKFQIYFYMIHPFTAKYTNFKGINYIYHTHFLEKLFRSGNVVFMDEEIRDYYLNKRSELFSGPNPFKMEKACRIVRLGMEIRAWDEREAVLKRKSKEFHIMTVCRMDFPFKAYVLGLVDDFSRLCKKYRDIRLDIIGDGDDINILKSKIESCSPDVKERILLLGNVPYKELDEHLKKAHILVGMGTTILDGAGNGVPCVIAASYQTEHYSCGMFHESPNVLNYVLGEEGSQKTDFYQEISRIRNLPEEEYVNICRKTYIEYKKYYDINKTMRELLGIKGRDVYISPFIPAYFKCIRLLVGIKMCFRKGIGYRKKRKETA